MNAIILACLLLPFSQATYYAVDENDEPYSIDEQVAPLGSDVFALFTYANWVMPSNFEEDIPTATYYGLARLPFHRLDFNYYSESCNGSFPTIVPDFGYEVWGSLFLIPVTDLDTVLEIGGKIDGQRAYQFLQKTVQVYLPDGTVIEVKCNAFQQKILPEKLIYGLPLPNDRRPSQQFIDMLTEAYIDGRLPSKYIEEIAMLPTTDQDIIETNLVTAKTD